MVETIPAVILIAGLFIFAFVAVPPLLHNPDTGANIVEQLLDVNVTNVTDGDVLIFQNGTWIALAGNFTGLNATTQAVNLTDVSFNAEEATIDDLTGQDCVNDVTVSFFNNTEENQYRRQAIQFCSNSDKDDNITWFYSIPQHFDSISPTDFKFLLYWADQNGEGGTFTKRVIASTDDAEESLRPSTLGDMKLSSTDLEMHQESGHSPPDDHDFVGMRWTNVTVPQGANITNATIQFHVDSTNPDLPLIVEFFGESIDNAPTYISTDFDLSSRNETVASVQWDIPDWVSVHDEGPAQRTPNLATIVQEIVDRAGWVSGNAMNIMIKDWIDNTGERHAESFNGEAASAPELSISFNTGGGSFTPVCFEFSLLAVESNEYLNNNFTSRQTVCKDRNGSDQLTITEFTITSADIEADDLVYFRIHRANDFVVDDFEGNVFMYGSELQWLN